MEKVLKKEVHKGFEAIGEDAQGKGFDELNIDIADDVTKALSAYTNRDCTILRANGEYEKPNVLITGGRVSVSLGRNVNKIQLRSVPGNGIRFFQNGTHSIPNGEYVLSLWGGTYPYPYIRACISYD
ncbi:hypothetical protein [uncultured Aquimarina sp.]|uniref:hypothetical protein n=1 Tax=uncultured Aquimarina sp. TaxID=575652 RepID=UPI00260D88A5|nr:hypothetical protein [uncultured Aquimarina sp.]